MKDASHGDFCFPPIPNKYAKYIAHDSVFSLDFSSAVSFQIFEIWLI